MSNEQTHPLHEKDRNIIDSLISKKDPDELDLVNLARLIKRYANFPGELELKKDIEKTLRFWQISENDLFLKPKIFGQITLDH